MNNENNYYECINQYFFYFFLFEVLIKFGFVTKFISRGNDANSFLSTHALELGQLFCESIDFLLQIKKEHCQSKKVVIQVLPSLQQTVIMLNVRLLHDVERVEWAIQVHQPNYFRRIYIEIYICAHGLGGISKYRCGLAV